LWAALNGISAIGRLAPDGAFDVIPTPTTGAGPVGITTANGGEVWFTEFQADQIGRVRPDGSITEYPLPQGSRPHAIAPDPWGGLWFTEWGAHRVGRITQAGLVEEFDLPPGVREPHGVSVSESGHVCVAAESGHLVFLDPA
jgi:virginiamycin B lyase